MSDIADWLDGYSHDLMEAGKFDQEAAFVAHGAAEIRKLRADVAAYAGQNTNLRNDLVQMGMARDAALAQVEGLRTSLEDAVETLEAMDLHINNPLYDRLREKLETIPSTEQSHG